MKKLLLATALMLVASPAMAKEYVIKEVTNPEGGDKPYYFEPGKLTIQPGDTVVFVNAQDDSHDVMFSEVPKEVDEMIMSEPMEKKGDKFSYTFKVPGTYQFHCHPHEELGMKGTIIVGSPSKKGETKAVSHHDMAEHVHVKDDNHAAQAASSDATGTGVINSVDASKRTVGITHDPIKSLGWPKMKMLFTAAEGVDLSGYKAGDAVTFTLQPVGKDDYSVTSLKKGK